MAQSVLIFISAFRQYSLMLHLSHTHTQQHAVNHTYYVEAGSVKATTAKLHPPSAVLSSTGLPEPPDVTDFIRYHILNCRTFINTHVFSVLLH